MTASSQIYQCPDCSRVVSFRHPGTTLFQCVCGSVLKRTGGLVVAKPFYIVSQPGDIIQPGTTGLWQGKAFTVLGRFRAWLNEAVLNYWTVAFDDQSLGYLGEGYGLYSIYISAPETKKVSANQLRGLKIGGVIRLSGSLSYLLEKKYTCHKWEIEGEAYMPECESAVVIYFLSAMKGGHLEAIAFSKGMVETFDVYYDTFASFNFTNTRAYQQGGKEHQCVNCNETNIIKTYPYAQSYACAKCGSRYVLGETGSFTIREEESTKYLESQIVRGSVGMIKGISYEVIGVALKEEKHSGNAYWKEYVLYNAEEGFAFLSEYNGNWLYAREQGNSPVFQGESNGGFTYADRYFKMFNRYTYRVLRAAGEFPNNAFDNGDNLAIEYIRPPSMWIREKDQSEGITWFLGEHINSDDLTRAFGDNITLPYKQGIGATEPTPYLSTAKIFAATLIAVVLLIFVFATSSLSKESRVIVDSNISFNDSTYSRSFVTSKFSLTKWKSNLMFEVTAPVDNSWLELNATLVNAVTGDEYSIEQGVEYYHGYSDGESWTEGNTSETVYLNSIPAGEYQLRINGVRERQNDYAGFTGKTPDGFKIVVTYDVPDDRNLIICVVAILVAGFLQYQVVLYFEKKRWSESPFSSYN